MTQTINKMASRKKKKSDTIKKTAKIISKQATKVTLEQKLQALTPTRRTKIKQRADELIANEMSLRDLRHAMQLTQERMAELLDLRQEGISRLEKRSDMLLSTLQSYINAMGGELKLFVEFPDKPPIKLTSFGDIVSNEEC